MYEYGVRAIRLKCLHPGHFVKNCKYDYCYMKYALFNKILTRHIAAFQGEL